MSETRLSQAATFMLRVALGDGAWALSRSVPIPSGAAFAANRPTELRGRA